MRTLTELLETLGDRRITVCRELTKKHEVAFQTTLSEAVKWYTANDPKGECVIVMEGKSRAELAAVQQRVWEEIECFRARGAVYEPGNRAKGCDEAGCKGSRRVEAGNLCGAVRDTGMRAIRW